MALVLKKLQLIYVPFILLCLLYVSGYSLLHWLLLIQFPLLSIDESIINFWLPLILPWPLLFFYLRPRLKLFRFTKSNSRFIYFVIAVLLLAVPTIVVQEYLNSATGKLTQLESINGLLHQPQTKYYQLNQFYIDKKHIGVQRNIEPIGKGNSELRMSLYIAMPIFAKRNESWRVGAKALAWYGKVYEKTISNRLEPHEKEFLYQEFIHQSQQAFNAFKPDEFVYLDRIGPSTRYTQLLSAAQKSSVYFEGYQTVLMPVNQPFEARNGHKLAWIIAWLSFGAILWLLMSLMLKLDETKLASKPLATQLSMAKPKAELYGFLAEFKPRPGFVITPILLYINSLIFVLMAFASQHFIAFPNSVLLDWGANLRQLVLEQQVWRLLSNVFCMAA
ncbi:MAG: rhomboid family intramembrane serine protease [Shewanella xiamenensis]|nr:rhomboid family intramembrane serine protease [Shewanella xiamenensis]